MTPGGEASEEALGERGDRPEPGGTVLSRSLGIAIPTAAVFLGGLFVYATAYTLHLGRALLLPVALAFLLSLVLERPVRALRSVGIPRVLSTLAILASLLAVLITGFYYLSFPASTLVEELPEQLERLETRFRSLGEAARTARELDEAAQSLDGDDSEPPTVEVRGPGLVEVTLGYAQSLGAGLIVVVVLVAMLLSREDYYLQGMLAIGSNDDESFALRVYRSIGREISYYLGTITLINVGLGVATALAMAWIGLPNPILWGVLAGVLNFIIYLGPLVTAALLAVVGLTTFDDPLRMALPPLAFLCINLVEAYGVTPIIVGRRLHLDPVSILLSLAFWGFVWGVPGMLLAVPFLAVGKLIAEQIDLSHWVTSVFSR